MDYEKTKKWDGGFVFDLRPQVDFLMEDSIVTLYGDVQWGRNPDLSKFNCWCCGLCWTVNIAELKRY